MSRLLQVYAAFVPRTALDDTRYERLKIAFVLCTPELPEDDRVARFGRIAHVPEEVARPFLRALEDPETWEKETQPLSLETK